MFPLILEAYWELVRFERHVARGDFAELYSRVRDCSIRRTRRNPDRVGQVSAAVDLASIWFWKKVSCLHRSAAGACLLRRRGIAAQLVIGAELMPFRAHAWIEVEGRVVNDKPYVSEMYAVLERC